MLLLRFAALQLFVLAANLSLLHFLAGATFGALSAGALGAAIVLAIELLILPRLDLTAEDRLSIGTAGVAAILVISAIVNYGLYAALLLTLPALQPLAAMILATAASMLFSFFGYSRFVFRSE